MTSFHGFEIPGGWELWIILAIFLLLFGHRFSGMARAVGSGMVEFKKDGTDDEGLQGDAAATAGLGAAEKQPQVTGTTTR